MALLSQDSGSLTNGSKTMAEAYRSYHLATKEFLLLTQKHYCADFVEVMALPVNLNFESVLGQGFDTKLTNELPRQVLDFNKNGNSCSLPLE